MLFLLRHCFWLAPLFRYSGREVFCKKDILNLVKLQENTCPWIYFLIKLFKKETQKKVFSCDFVNIFRTYFFTEHLWRLFLTILPIYQVPRGVLSLIWTIFAIFCSLFSSQFSSFLSFGFSLFNLTSSHFSIFTKNVSNDAVLWDHLLSTQNIPKN